MNPKLRLILLSFLMLFVELALIRWAGSNVVYLSYFSNFVLLGSFLGIGLGFLRANSKRNLFPYAPVALAALVLFIRVANVRIEGGGDDLLFFGGSALRTSGSPRELVLAVIFLVVAAAMAFIAEGVARTFVQFEPLVAYRLDLIGSIGGIAGFSLLALLRAPPLVWGGIAAAVMVLLYRPAAGWTLWLRVLSIGVLLGVLGIETFTAGTSWSPYYKIETTKAPVPEANGGKYEATSIKVNGVPHQANIKITDNPLYNRVYERVQPGNIGRVLIVGAGGGNDVSAALARGAKHIDAVEIDPRLYEIGKADHPDHPYNDPRVSVHIDDGRAFLERTDRKYDLILFALPDSITLVSGQSALRLESYLFTKEALESAKSHLNAGGVFSMYNYYRENWLVDRFAGTLDEVYGHRPCVSSISGESPVRLAVIIASTDRRSIRCESSWRASGEVPKPATDDHPFPYLRHGNLPVFYIVVISLILLASVFLIRAGSGPFRPMIRYLDLFFMGAAFLLLETKNVVQFALLFGTTWFVNALVFTGILLSVLAAVEVSKRITFRHPARLYLVLLAALAVAWFVPPGALLSLSFAPRFIAAVTIAFFPIFTANIVFTQRFKDASASATAFGANLLGAMVGGLLEYSALIVGYRALLFLAAALYGIAFLLGRRHLVRVPERAVEAEPVPVG
jgi:spermine/spermidine synthase